MDYTKANEYAIDKASNEFGSDIMQKINNQSISAATGKLSYIIAMIKGLSNFFEEQSQAVCEDKKAFVVMVHDFVKTTLDGGDDSQGIIQQIKQYFLIQEFERDPEKKKAISLYLIHYVTYIKYNVEFVPVEMFLEFSEDVTLNARYFDKEKVFGDIIKLIKQY